MNKKIVRIMNIILIITLALIASAGAAVAQEGGTVIAEGLNLPQGILVTDDGSVWVIEAGAGGETEVEYVDVTTLEPATAMVGETARVIQIAPDGTQTVVATLLSVMAGDAVGGARLAVLEGNLYATIGHWISGVTPEEGPHPAAVVRILEEGELVEVTQTWMVERDENPDGAIMESHPYGLTAGPDGYLWVADAAGNDLLRIDPDTGDLEVVTAFEAIPGVFPNPNRGGELLADPVPTAVAFDEAGNAYVSILSGAPFVPGSAKVLQVTPEGEVSDFATGLTMLTDLRAGPDGALYAVQIGMFTEEGPVPDAGALLRIQEGEGTSEVVVEGLSFPTSVDFNADGDAFLTINGGFSPPGSGAVVMYPGVATSAMAEPAPAEPAMAEPAMAIPSCDALPSHQELTGALSAVVAGADSGGFGLNMWATTVNRDGEVCAVTFSGQDRGDQWPGSRVISAQKANTANAFSLPGLALATANLFTAVQPGNSLFGLQHSNPVDTAVAYGGDGEAFGQADDPMVGQRVGGVNVFGGGLALYDEEGTLLGALGVSGDTSCTDHIIAWKVRDALGLDYVPLGVSDTGDDNIVYDPESGWSHPECGLGELPISEALPVDFPIGSQ